MSALSSRLACRRSERSASAQRMRTVDVQSTPTSFSLIIPDDGDRYCRRKLDTFDVKFSPLGIAGVVGRGANPS